MLIKALKVKKISSHVFAPYGQLLELPSRKRDSGDEAYSWWNGNANLMSDGPVGTGLMKTQRREFVVSKLERHLRTAELLIPLQGSSIITVANGDCHNLQSIDGFYLEIGQAILMSKGTWHSLPYPLGQEAVFLVVFREKTGEDDLEFLNLEQGDLCKYRLAL